MITEQWDWDEEGKEVNFYLSDIDMDDLDQIIDDVLRKNELDTFFKHASPQDLDDLIKTVMGKMNKEQRKLKKPKPDFLKIADQYNLPLDYVLDEFDV